MKARGEGCHFEMDEASRWIEIEIENQFEIKMVKKYHKKAWKFGRQMLISDLAKQKSFSTTDKTQTVFPD